MKGGRIIFKKNNLIIREKLALVILVLFQLLLLWFDSGLELVIFLTHYSGCILIRTLLLILVIVGRYHLFSCCRDSRMLLFGFFGALLLLTFFSYYPARLGQVWLSWFYYLFDIGVFSVLIGIIFELTAVILWEITKNPRPFGLNLSLFSQRMRARREIISVLSKFIFFYCCLGCLGFILLNMYYLFNWRLYLKLTAGIVLGSFLWLVGSFQNRLQNKVNSYLTKIDLKLEALLKEDRVEFKSDELRFLQTYRQLLSASTSIVLRWENLFYLLFGLFLFMILPRK